MARDRSSRPEAKPLRLFVAVDVPEGVGELVAAAIAPWRERFPKARWVPPTNWHVTMKFLGATWPRLLEWVDQTLEHVAGGAEPFESRVEALGGFPSLRRARVLWAGLTDPDQGFARLAGGLDAALSKEFKPENRAFTAHLTVARSDPPIPLPEGFAETELRSEPFTVDRLVLYRSYVRRPAPVYEPLREFPLGARKG